MHEAGIAAFQARKELKSAIYTYENEALNFTAAFEKQFKANKAAWKYFQSLAPGYQKLSCNWVMSAKQDTTKAKRLARLIKDSAAGTNRWKDNKYKKK